MFFQNNNNKVFTNLLQNLKIKSKKQVVFMVIKFKIDQNFIVLNKILKSG